MKTLEQQAVELRDTLRELADAVIPALNGDKAARRLLANWTDGYWHGIVIGTGTVESICHAGEDDDEADDGPGVDLAAEAAGK